MEEKLGGLKDVFSITPFTPIIVYVLIGLMVLDIVTGLVAAGIQNKIDSSYSFTGMLKKAQMLLMVMAGLLFEFIYPDIPWGKLIASFMCINEIISITENAGESGVPLPEQLKDTLKRLRTDKEPLSKLEIKVDAPATKQIKIESVTSSKLLQNQPTNTKTTTTTTVTEVNPSTVVMPEQITQQPIRHNRLSINQDSSQEN